MCDQDHFEDDRLRVRIWRHGDTAAVRRPGGCWRGADAAEGRQRGRGDRDGCDDQDAGRHVRRLLRAPGNRDGSAVCLMWPDIFGLRPAFHQMGKRLAETGYSVLVVNPFYRTQKAPTAAKGAATPIPDLLPLAKTLSPTTHMTDAKAFTAWLDQQASVAKNRKMGTQGYCMGGPMAFRTAAASDRVGAIASFHGGGLVTMDADSPHLLASKTKASLLIAIASNDDKQRPMEKDVLKETFGKSGQSAEIEVYSGAHGWCPPDSGVYNEPDAEKAWTRLMASVRKGSRLRSFRAR